MGDCEGGGVFLFRAAVTEVTKWGRGDYERTDRGRQRGGTGGTVRGVTGKGGDGLWCDVGLRDGRSVNDRDWH